MGIDETQEAGDGNYRTIVFWSCYGDAENLTDTDPDDAIRDYLDGFLSPGCDVLEMLPETVELYGYARMKTDGIELDADSILERVLENLDDEYGDPDDRTTPTPAMKKAAKAFVAVIRDEYKVWSCEVVNRQVIQVEDWVRENEPEWLEG